MIKSGMSKIRKSLVDGLIRPVRAARDDSPQIDESSDYSSSGSDDTRDSDSASGSDSESSASGTNKKVLDGESRHVRHGYRPPFD